MILIIRLLSKSLTLGLFDPRDQFFIEQNATWKVGSNNSFVKQVTLLRQKFNIRVDEIKLIVVAIKKGSYTSSRIILAFINAYAWAKQIPIISIPKEFSELSLTEIAKIYQKCPKIKPPLFPTYDDDKN